MISRVPPASSSLAAFGVSAFFTQVFAISASIAAARAQKQLEDETKVRFEAIQKEAVNGK